MRQLFSKQLQVGFDFHHPLHVLHAPCACSSEAERRLDKANVTGAIPVMRTTVVARHGARLELMLDAKAVSRQTGLAVTMSCSSSWPRTPDSLSGNAGSNPAHDAKRFCPCSSADQSTRLRTEVSEVQFLSGALGARARGQLALVSHHLRDDWCTRRFISLRRLAARRVMAMLLAGKPRGARSEVRPGRRGSSRSREVVSVRSPKPLRQGSIPWRPAMRRADHLAVMSVSYAERGGFDSLARHLLI